MNSAQIPFLVEAILILVAMVFGILLGKAGKPYGKIKIGIHLFFFLWFSVGFAFIVSALPFGKITNLTMVFVVAMGIAILVQTATGLLMLISKGPVKVLPKIHVSSACLLLVSDAAAFLLTGNIS